jgi:predicted RNA-binding protein
MQETNYFILVNSDGFSPFNYRVDACIIADFRLKQKAYPLHKGTHCRHKIKSNDQFIFYIAGKSALRTSVYAYGIIGKDLKPQHYSEDEVHVGNPSSKVIELKSCKKISNGLSLRDIKDDLDFIKDKKFWGRYLQGGITEISKQDYDCIIANATSL